MQNSVRMRNIKLRKVAFSLALFPLLASVQMALAHGGAQHVMGTVTKVSAQSVTVETTDKKVVEVALTPATKYTRDKKKVASTDVKTGDRVMIEAKAVNEKLVADSVQLGTAATKATKAESSAHSHK